MILQHGRLSGNQRPVHRLYGPGSHYPVHDTCAKYRRYSELSGSHLTGPRRYGQAAGSTCRKPSLWSGGAKRLLVGDGVPRSWDDDGWMRASREEVGVTAPGRDAIHAVFVLLSCPAGCAGLSARNVSGNKVAHHSIDGFYLEMTGRIS